jgi:chromosome partitioning protein
MIKIVLSNNKGGVTKTTSTINIGSALAKNKRVALIDFDSQKNLSVNIAHSEGSDLATVLKNKKIEIRDFAKTQNPNLFILPNKGDVSIQLFSQFATDEQPYLLLDCLETLPKDSFDYILIDTPPNLELQTVNALLASDYVLLPATLETNSILGVQNTINTIKRIQARLNPNLNFLGVFLSKYDERLTSTNKSMTNELLEILKNKDLLLKSKIRTNSSFSKNQMERQTTFEDKNDKKGSEDYLNLAIEISKNVN